MGDRAVSRGAVRAVARRPDLWAVAIAQAARLARPRWWAHAPFLPLPDRDYARFRLETQYGRDAPADGISPRDLVARSGDDFSARFGDDLVAYLEWCREVGRLSRAREERR